MSLVRTDRDDEAFAAWVEQHGAGLLRSAYLMTGSRAAAEDLVQSVLLRALPRWRVLSTTQDPLAYVRRALLNRAHGHLAPAQAAQRAAVRRATGPAGSGRHRQR